MIRYQHALRAVSFAVGSVVRLARWRRACSVDSTNSAVGYQQRRTTQPHSPRSCRTRSATSTASRSRTTPTSTPARTRARRTSSTSSRSFPSTSTRIGTSSRARSCRWSGSRRSNRRKPCRSAPARRRSRLSSRRANPVNGWLWGVGPVVQIPTISNKSLGSNVWGGGPTGVLVYMKGPWVAGVLANNVWSFGGTPGLGGTRYNTFLTQPFVELQFRRGMVCRQPPIITANWLTSGNNAWTLPVGADRPCREDRRQAACQFPCRRLLQRAATAIRLDLAA